VVMSQKSKLLDFDADLYLIQKLYIRKAATVLSNISVSAEVCNICRFLFLL